MKHLRLWMVLSAGAAAMFWASGVVAQAPSSSKTITEADCTAAKLGGSVPASGSQLDYYQAVLDKMSRSKVDSFARLFVLAQTGHGLSGNNYGTDGDGKQIESKPIPNTFDRFALLVDWVENGKGRGSRSQ